MIEFACPYCGEMIPVDAGMVTSVTGTSSVDELTTFTVSFIARHRGAKCRREQLASTT